MGLPFTCVFRMHPLRETPAGRCEQVPIIFIKVDLGPHVNILLISELSV